MSIYSLFSYTKLEYIDIGTLQNPVLSCKDLRPNSTNGLYWLKNPQGNISQQYCAMDRDMCGTSGGWMRVAYVDMTQPGQECPTEFTTITTPKRLCGRLGQASEGCVSTKFSTSDFSYSQVCGKVIAYQNNTPDGYAAGLLRQAVHPPNSPQMISPTPKCVERSLHTKIRPRTAHAHFV